MLLEFKENIRGYAKALIFGPRKSIGLNVIFMLINNLERGIK